MNDSAVSATGLDIKLARIRGGIRQYELAAAVGIAPQRLLLIENGRLPASERFFRRLLQLIEGWPERGRENLGLYGRLVPPAPMPGWKRRSWRPCGRPSG